MEHCECNINKVETKDYKELREVLEYCLMWHADDINNVKRYLYEYSKVRGVFDKHDGKKFSLNKDQYSKEYLLNIKSDLNNNFSKERYLHALEVANFIDNNIGNKISEMELNYLESDEHKKHIYESIKDIEDNVSGIYAIICVALIFILFCMYIFY